MTNDLIIQMEQKHRQAILDKANVMISDLKQQQADEANLSSAEKQRKEAAKKESERIK